MEISDLHRILLSSEGVSTDSRVDLTDKLFFALKGENFDGNKFAISAVKNGAELAIIDDAKFQKQDGCIYVDNVLDTLQELAAFHRKFLNLPIIAITGSNGKTTTKELVSAVLSKKFDTVHTRGNLNNHIGVPLTLLRMKESTEIGVVEMGANHQKEIESLCKITQPDYGYITNFGKAHLEGFGGFEGVIKGKSELYDYLKNAGKRIFVNIDDELQVNQSKGGERIEFGIKSDTNNKIEFRSADPFVKLRFQGVEIDSRLMGEYNAKNMAATIFIGHYFGVNKRLIKEALEAYNPDNNRSQIMVKASNKVLMDAYNANPTSMRLALENLENFPGKRKIAILGDMFEIGKTTLKEHQYIVDILENSNIDQAYICGEAFNKTKVEDNRVKAYKTFDDLKRSLLDVDIADSIILVKGSRGMALERVLEVL